MLDFTKATNLDYTKATDVHYVEPDGSWFEFTIDGIVMRARPIPGLLHYDGIMAAGIEIAEYT
ncbi:hypothetical protein [Rhodopseudomonas telluris]|uniref:Uncharacterized protein n=1 Tax=Rhodopseudomonas telluris TaxID=644215 RepID=A0ABV6EZV3_9BRAD